MPYVKSVTGYCITSIKKVTLDPELATFRIKTLNFTRVIRLNCLANIKLRVRAPGSILLLGAHLNIIVGGLLKLAGKNLIDGEQAPCINIIVNYCRTRVPLYAKRPKKKLKLKKQ